MRRQSPRSSRRLRALKAGPPLRNDLIVLFTDGEELGLLGAQGFVETYPALHDIKVVLNFEMRGDYGPSMMFQTSAHNSWLVDQLAAAAPFPYATSAAPAVYKRLPNDTDLTVFLDAGMAGMNFAAAGGITRYHTELDNVDLLDQRTLQHQGSYVLSLARRFGSIDLNAPLKGDAVFFVIFGELIHYAAWLAIPLAIVVTVLVLSAIWLGIRDGRLSIGSIGAGFAIYSIAVVAAVAEARGMWSLMAALAGWRMLPVHTTYGGFYFSVATDALIFGTLWTAYELISRWIHLRNLGAGALLVWTVMMLATSIAMPAGSYIFTWPLLFAPLAMRYRPRAANNRDAILSAIIALLALAPATVMLAPLFAASADGTMLFLLFCGLTAVLLFGLFVPYLDFLTAGRRWIVPARAGSAGNRHDHQRQRGQLTSTRPSRIPTASFIFRTPTANAHDGSAWIHGPTGSPRSFFSITCAADGCRNSPVSRPETRRTGTSPASRATLHI